MTDRRLRTAAQASALALLLVALGAGVPVHGHADHHGDIAHLGPPGHAHGVALVQHEMRLERPSPPLFVAGPAASFALPLPAPRTVLLPPREDPSWSSRAPPPTSRPRAPPA